MNCITSWLKRNAKSGRPFTKVLCLCGPKFKLLNNESSHRNNHIKIMKKSKEIIIRVSLLLIMVILGLIVVFPQSLDLKDFIIEDNKAKIVKQKQKVKSWINSLPSFGNISPSKREIKNFILSIENVKRVYCIGDIQETFYSKEDGIKKKTLAPFNIKFQAVIQKGDDLKLKTSYLILTPKMRTVNYGHWIWPDNKNVFDGWQYKENPSTLNREKDFKNTNTFNLFGSKKIQKCGY